MRDISNLLRQRLKAVPEPPEPTPHPEADLLAAYAEGALPQGERTAVTHHLAHCADCREILVLSLPGGQAATPAANRKIERWMAAFRWSAVAAVLIVGVTLVIEKPWETERQAAVLRSATVEQVQMQAPA